MRSLFETDALEDILNRLEKLSPEAQPEWGSMSVAQMLKHLKTTLKVATGEVTLRTPPFYKKVLFRLFKSSLYNDTPWKKNLPTARKLKMTEPEDFEVQKKELKETITTFLNISFPDGKREHPVFGTFTKQQWGQSQYKHFDHHLRQFGV
ncbi:DUF1569 domain-containing protein [Robertkochia flava]|uniref:DUF1569 domain-containing protein n=1 Tax=Robertkochia flava TaxID=3447986 RepID=UPI001CC8F429|nr:DUF1569 domain-containing protein [Robertkochia marina]